MTWKLRHYFLQFSLFKMEVESPRTVSMYQPCIAVTSAWWLEDQPLQIFYILHEKNG